jgi:hypothetical protein
MALAVVVGVLADTRPGHPAAAFHRRRFQAVAEALRQAGLPPHTEPDDVEPRSYEMYSASALHYLRRVAAHLSAGRPLPPPGGRDAPVDPLLRAYHAADEALARRLEAGERPRPARVGEFDQLIRHPDSDGVYLPIDLDEVLVPATPALREAVGERIGSAPRLLQECQRLAAALALPSGLDPDSPALWRAADHQGDGQGWQRYGIEAFTCVRLLAAADHSLASGAAVVFT